MNLFSRNKESSDPGIIIDNCLHALLNRISDDLDGEGYHWKKPWGVKRFESIVLAKFMIKLAFNRLSEDKLKDDEKTGFETLCNASFTTLFNNEFSGVGLNFEDMQEEIQRKIDGYFESRRENRPPLCWHVIYQQIIRSKSKEEIEEDIQMARRYYNGTVRNNNVLVESFPTNLVANAFSFEKADFFEIEDQKVRDIPKVEF